MPQKVQIVCRYTQILELYDVKNLSFPAWNNSNPVTRTRIRSQKRSLALKAKRHKASEALGWGKSKGLKIWIFTRIWFNLEGLEPAGGWTMASDQGGGYLDIEEYLASNWRSVMISKDSLSTRRPFWKQVKSKRALDFWPKKVQNVLLPITSRMETQRGKISGYDSNDQRWWRKRFLEMGADWFYAFPHMIVERMRMMYATALRWWAITFSSRA